MNDRTGSRFSRKAALVAAFFVSTAPSNAHAWSKHTTFMPWILEGAASKEARVKTALEKPGQSPTLAEDRATYSKLAEEFQLRADAPVTPTAARIPQEVLKRFAADEPDFGMDLDLPEAADPHGERKYMGGATGPTSQGFRHMFFGGWKWRHPLRTFQVPTRAIGQAPRRADLFAHKARALYRAGETLWAFRVLGWSMHFVQDLAQPFHSVQIPNMAMVPWKALLQWPPQAGFEKLVAETTRTISNYHYAYEGYVLKRLQEGDASPFAPCFKTPEEFAQLDFDTRRDSPEKLALEVARRSIEIGPEVGAACMGFFGHELKEPHRDLPRGKGVLDYEALARDPALAKERERLEKVTCQALAHGALASRHLLEWVTKPKKPGW